MCDGHCSTAKSAYIAPAQPKPVRSGRYSAVGHTRTAPAEGWVGEFTYAVFACSRWEGGYFHAYKVAAHIKNLDLWIHTGDYIYEYGNTGERLIRILLLLLLS